MTDDARIEHQRLDIPFVVSGNYRRIESSEGGLIALASAENRPPAQSGLGTLEGDHLEQMTVVALGIPHSRS